MRENEFYACPKENKRPCIIDPAPYEMGGKTVMMSSFNVPIMVGDQFRGAVGADLSLAFIQDLLKRADQQLYDGAGEMALIASNGRLVAYTRDDSKLGEPAGSVLDGNEVDNLKTSRSTSRSTTSTPSTATSSCSCLSPSPTAACAGPSCCRFPRRRYSANCSNSRAS